MNIPNRLQVKLYFDEKSDVPVKEFIPVFHKWIQNQESDDLLVDVHDYSHVHHGPGILLVTHEGDFSVDLGDGRTGLLYRRKRSRPEDLNGLVLLVLQRVIHGALRLEQDDTLSGNVRFRTDEFEISVADRLRFPNDAGVYSRLEPDLLKAFEEVFETGNIALERVENDPREPLTVHAGVESPLTLEELASRLEGETAGS